MFDVGWQEVGLTAVVALLVLGPKELPGLMRTAGLLVRRARLIAHDFRMNLEDMADQIELEEFSKNAKVEADKKEPVLNRHPGEGRDLLPSSDVESGLRRDDEEGGEP